MLKNIFSVLFLLVFAVGFGSMQVKAGDIDFADAQAINEGVDEAPVEDLDDTSCPVERKCVEECCQEGECCNEEGRCCEECASERSCLARGLCLASHDGCYVCVECE